MNDFFSTVLINKLDLGISLKLMFRQYRRSQEQITTKKHLFYLLFFKLSLRGQWDKKSLNTMQNDPVPLFVHQTRLELNLQLLSRS